MLYRKIQPYIESYLKSDSNKVLIIDGARQIGKTFIIRYVGQQFFENYIELRRIITVHGCLSRSAPSRTSISKSVPSPASEWERRKTR